jgi:hypothetical protein
MAPRRPFPMGRAFSQVLSDGTVYQSLKAGFCCEKPAVVKVRKKRERKSFMAGVQVNRALSGFRRVAYRIAKKMQEDKALFLLHLILFKQVILFTYSS